MVNRNLEIVLVRHGNAEPAEEGGPDSSRKLSGKGRAQAIARHNSLVQLNPKPLDLILVSPTDRTRETAELIAGDSFRTSRVEELDELFTPQGTDDASTEIRDALEDMFDRLKYEPIVVYYADSTHGADCLKEFGRSAWRAILEMASKTGAERILVVGHAVYTPCMAFEASGDEGLLNLNMAECGAIQVLLRNGETVAVNILSDVRILEVPA